MINAKNQFQRIVVRLLRHAKYQSMTSRSALKNKFISITNNAGNNSNNSNNNKNNSSASNCFSFVKFNNNDRNENKRISHPNYSHCLRKLVSMASTIGANHHSNDNNSCFTKCMRVNIALHSTVNSAGHGKKRLIFEELFI